MQGITTKQPCECTNIDEVRNEIDRIDQHIIQMLSERFEYVKEVVKYKEPTPDSIVASDRRNAVLQNRRKLAEQNGLNPDVIEQIYSILIQYFIDEEMKEASIKTETL